MILVPLLLGGCGQASDLQSALEPAGAAADAIADLWWYFFAVSTVVVVVVSALLLYGPLRAREESPEEGAAANRRKTRAVVGGVAVTLVVLVGTLLFSLFTGRGLVEGREPPVAVEVVGWRFWWEVRYLDAEGEVVATTANELHLPVGETVPIFVRTADVIHSFWVPNLHGKIDMIPGRVNRIEVRATEPGVFRGQCAEFCGYQHAMMAFMVVVEPPEEFRAYLAREARPAKVPRDPVALRGLDAFVENGCGDCHAVRGTPADGEFGPDLTHLASRLTLGAGVLPNTKGHLGGWIANPQRIKPGNNMPWVPLTSEELTAIVRYLETLR